MLRLVAALLLAGFVSNGAQAQTSGKPAPEEEEKPLVTPPKLIRFVEAAYPETEGDEPIEAVV
ncbi:MAG: hypothetical protein ACERK0_01395, partial [Deltaproteobacteria bacterium]